ncbi:TfuA domain protein core [Methanococcus vannielii SB]|jgi:hypothetical protein|uniref:TfuA domain protein core n=1 Tax=Methanococcus vannielii (strain ATCC 35089 / DSM 1224 / JCM 13029 / OCM 148 / SB) TaxID=406327 RepID=A6UPB4_METVS|nr:TfuA-like protein [Methanococcus vannielii]ABR54336.1 TfuA domain protein core [Methanococcus vannielii SB]
MKVAIFSKLTVKENEIRSIMKYFDVDIYPPIKRGDLTFEKMKEYGVIGIIDGCFLQNTAVSHREILKIMENGVKVFGSGSMGALRASELDTYGMIGIGKVYYKYKSGIVFDDDEVAVTFDENLNQITFSMVSFREMVNSALVEGIITKIDAQNIIDAGKNLYYPLRTYENAIKKAGILEDKKETLLNYLEKQEDIKRKDAFEMISKIIEYVNCNINIV